MAVILLTNTAMTLQFAAFFPDELQLWLLPE